MFLLEKFSFYGFKSLIWIGIEKRIWFYDLCFFIIVFWEVVVGLIAVLRQIIETLVDDSRSWSQIVIRLLTREMSKFGGSYTQHNRLVHNYIHLKVLLRLLYVLFVGVCVPTRHNFYNINNNRNKVFHHFFLLLSFYTSLRTG